MLNNTKRIIIISLIIFAPVNLYAQNSNSKIIQSYYISPSHFANIDLPKRINIFTRDRVTDFRPINKSLGITVQYLDRNNLAIIRFYDSINRNMPNTTNVNKKNQFLNLLGPFQEANSRLLRLKESGYYSKVKQKNKSDYPKNCVLFMCTGYDLEKNGISIDGYLYITSYNNKLINIMITLPASKDSAKISKDFIDQFRKSF